MGEKQCKGTRFMEHGEHKYSDYQEVRLETYTTNTYFPATCCKHAACWVVVPNRYGAAEAYPGIIDTICAYLSVERH